MSTNIVNRRNASDALLTATKALPAAAAAATSDAIEIGGKGPHREGTKLRVSWPVNSVLVADKTLIITLQSSTTSTLADATAPGSTHTITGATGFAAGSVDFELGQNVGAFTGFKAAVETGGGSNIATILTGEIIK